MEALGDSDIADFTDHTATLLVHRIGKIEEFYEYTMMFDHNNYIKMIDAMDDHDQES